MKIKTSLLLLILPLAQCSSTPRPVVKLDITSPVITREIYAVEKQTFHLEPEGDSYETSPSEKPSGHTLGAWEDLAYALSMLYPPNWFRRTHTVDGNDILLHKVVLINEQGEKETLDYVLLRNVGLDDHFLEHCREDRNALYACDSIKDDVINNSPPPGIKLPKDWSNPFYYAYNVLCYRDQTYPLDLFTRKEEDKDKRVYIGHIRLFNRYFEDWDEAKGEWKFPMLKERSTYGKAVRGYSEYGKFVFDVSGDADKSR